MSSSQGRLQTWQVLMPMPRLKLSNLTILHISYPDILQHDNYTQTVESATYVTIGLHRTLRKAPSNFPMLRLA